MNDVPAPHDKTPRASLVLGVLLASAFVMLLNETILSLGLRNLAADLDVSITTVQWLTSGFLLTMAVVLPATGFLLDRFPVRRVFLASAGLFCAGTVICALAPGFPMLLLGRVVQACGTAMILPLATTTVMRLAAPSRRGAMMGTFSLVIAFAPALGPAIGGVILAQLGWRWMFFAVLPLALLTVLVGAVVVRVPSETRQVPLDLSSVPLAGLAFGGLLYGLTALGHTEAHTVAPWLPLVVGAVSLALFARRQVSLQRHRHALLDLRPFGHREFTAGALVIFPLFMVQLGVGSVLLPLHVQSVLGHGTLATGLAVLPGGLALGFLGRPAGRLFDRFGTRPVVLSGAVAMAVALGLFAVLGDGASLAGVVGVHVLMMAGIGLMTTPLLTGPLVALPGELYGHGSAILGTLTQLAGAFGTASFVTAAAVGSADPLGATDAGGTRIAFAAAAGVGVLAVIGALFIRDRDRSPDASGERPADEGVRT